MNNSTATWQSSIGRAARAAGVLAFVALVGPAIGALLFPSPLYGPQIWWALMTSGEGAVTDKLAVLGYVMMGSYALGILPAAVAGLVMGVATWWNGRFGYLVAALAGLTGTLAVGLLYLSGVSTADVTSGGAVALLVFYLPISVAAALICRGLLALVRILPRSERVST